MIALFLYALITSGIVGVAISWVVLYNTVQKVKQLSARVEDYDTLLLNK